VKRFKYLVLTLCFTLTLPVLAAPLFPDVPDNHWAKDAVAALAAKGLVEGYPDGTFKGDRSASRWETAMIVARLLAKMEQAHATFATKAELDELRKLANALREELDALGVRVDNLEENVGLLDQRVTELERITFYGFVDTRVAFQSFRNTGRDSMRSLNPAMLFDTIDYNAIVGTAGGAGGRTAQFSGTAPLGDTMPIQPPSSAGVVPTFNPFTTGVLSTTNWRTGRPLTSGTGFTTRAILGMDIKVSDSLDAGVEFSAYTSQGDQVVDAFYGVQQPYLSNPFTARANDANGTGVAQGLGSSPYTRMNLERFWVRHNESGTKLIVGSYDEHDFNDAVFVGFLNPNENGPEYLQNYGFLVDGAFAVGEDEDTNIKWQVMGTLLPNGSTGPVTPNSVGSFTGYQSYAAGIKLGVDFHEERGKVNFNFLRAADEASGGAALTTGLIQTPNLSRQINWVNPNGFYLNQLAGQFGATAGIGSTSDIRPVPMNGNPLFGNDGSQAARVAAGLLPQGVPNVGGIGPQDQTTWGLDFEYTFDQSWSPKVFGQWATSTYRPNKNSSYTADGDAWNLGASVLLLDGDLDLEVRYTSVDPRFSPFLIETPTVAGISTPQWKTPGFLYFQNMYSLHDTYELPHNREGFRFKSTWKFLPTGRFSIDYSNYDQKVSSLQDVRYGVGALGPGTPNTPVLGNSPGWIEPLFGGYSEFTFAAAGGNSLAVPLEDNKGNVESLLLSGGYKWLLDSENNNRGVTLKGGFRNNHFDRKSNMQAIGAANGFAGAGTQAENQNLVDLIFRGWNIQVDYDVTEDFAVYGGFTNVDIKGHFDPFNVNGQYAQSTGVTNFNNIDINQTWPELGFDWEIAEDLTWGANGKLFSFRDQVPAYVFNTPQVPSLNINNGPQTAHPFSWEGIQIQSQFSLKF
jgi:S-layer homology domain